MAPDKLSLILKELQEKANLKEIKKIMVTEEKNSEGSLQIPSVLKKPEAKNSNQEIVTFTGLNLPNNHCLIAEEGDGFDKLAKSLGGKHDETTLRMACFQYYSNLSDHDKKNFEITLQIIFPHKKDITHYDYSYVQYKEQYFSKKRQGKSNFWPFIAKIDGVILCRALPSIFPNGIHVIEISQFGPEHFRITESGDEKIHDAKLIEELYKAPTLVLHDGNIFSMEKQKALPSVSQPVDQHLFLKNSKTEVGTFVPDEKASEPSFIDAVVQEIIYPEGWTITITTAGKDVKLDYTLNKQLAFSYFFVEFDFGHLLKDIQIFLNEDQLKTIEILMKLPFANSFMPLNVLKKNGELISSEKLSANNNDASLSVIKALRSKMMSYFSAPMDIVDSRFEDGLLVSESMHVSIKESLKKVFAENNMKVFEISMTSYDYTEDHPEGKEVRQAWPRDSCRGDGDDIILPAQGLNEKSSEVALRFLRVVSQSYVSLETQNPKKNPLANDASFGSNVHINTPQMDDRKVFLATLNNKNIPASINLMSGIIEGGNMFTTENGETIIGIHSVVALAALYSTYNLYKSSSLLKIYQAGKPLNSGIYSTEFEADNYSPVKNAFISWWSAESKGKFEKSDTVLMEELLKIKDPLQLRIEIAEIIKNNLGKASFSEEFNLLSRFVEAIEWYHVEYIKIFVLPQELRRMPDKIIITRNHSYHNDLLLLYLGGNKFAIGNYLLTAQAVKQTRDFLKNKNTAFYPKQNIDDDIDFLDKVIKSGTIMHRTRGPALLQTKKQLEERGYEVIEIPAPAMVLPEIPASKISSPTGETDLSNSDFSSDDSASPLEDNPKIYSCFNNGILYRTKNGTAVATANVAHPALFYLAIVTAKKFKDVGIELKILGNFGIAKKMYDGSGSLRCKTVNISCFTQVRGDLKLIIEKTTSMRKHSQTAEHLDDFSESEDLESLNSPQIVNSEFSPSELGMQPNKTLTQTSFAANGKPPQVSSFSDSELSSSSTYGFMATTLSKSSIKTAVISSPPTMTTSLANPNPLSPVPSTPDIRHFDSQNNNSVKQANSSSDATIFTWVDDDEDEADIGENTGYDDQGNHGNDGSDDAAFEGDPSDSDSTLGRNFF